MLDALRRGASTWVAKALFAVLVVSFAIWGVADVFRGYGLGSLARVGSTEISADEFQRAFQLEIDGVSRQLGRRLTPEQARAFGLDQQVLARLIGAAAIDEHTKELKLGLSEQAIIESVQKEPAFQDPGGRFNKLALDGFLRQIGMSERGFLQTRQKDELRQQLTDALAAGTAAPATLVELLYKFREETRTVEHFAIDPDKVVKIGEPEEANLKEIYERQKSRFVTPERRQLAVLLLTTEEAKKRVQVADADIKATYDRDRERFDIPEKRRIQQIAFKDKAAAEAAARAVAQGKSFLEVAKETGASETDIELGLLTKPQLIDPKIADAAFALKKDEVSAPIEGRYALVLLKVTEIQPGRVRSFDEVKSEIRDRLAGEKARIEIDTLHDQIDEQRAAAKSLAQIAEALNLKLLAIAAADRSGRTPEGKPAIEGPDANTLIATAFASTVGVEGEPVETGDGGYAWVDVLSVAPEKQKPFEEVREEVKAVWRDLERRKLLGEVAARLIERAGKGEPLEKLAGEVGGKIETTKPYKRDARDSGLPENAVRLAFATPSGALATAETADGKSRLVLRVTNVVAPPSASKEQISRLTAEIGRSMQTEALATYLAALQERLGISVNEAVYRRALGIGGDRQ